MALHRCGHEPGEGGKLILKFALLLRERCLFREQLFVGCLQCRQTLAMFFAFRNALAPASDLLFVTRAFRTQGRLSLFRFRESSLQFGHFMELFLARGHLSF